MALHLHLGQSIEPRFAAMSMNLQILMHSPNRMSACNGVGRAIGCEHEHGSSSITPREKRQNVKRREVTPVEILKNNDQRAIRAQNFHEIAEFAQHSFPCGPEHFLLKIRAIRLFTEMRHLEHPRWCMSPNCLQRGRSAWAATPCHQGIDQRVKGFISPEPLHAAPTQHIHAVSGQLPDRHFDERGLTYARLACDEDDLPLAGEHSLRHAVQGFQWRSSSNPPTDRFRLLYRYVLGGRRQSIDDPHILFARYRGAGVQRADRLCTGESRLRTFVKSNLIDTYLSRDVFELLLTYILKGDSEPVETGVHVFLDPA